MVGRPSHLRQPLRGLRHERASNDQGTALMQTGGIPYALSGTQRQHQQAAM